MLRHLGERDRGDAVERAVHAALAQPEDRTPDLGGSASLERFTDSVIDRVG
jgi:isocitrate/isopropylmalate dehydrogenase